MSAMLSSLIFLLFLFTISLHNAEEAIWLIRLTGNSRIRLHKTVTQDQFLFAVIAVTAAAYFVTSMFLFYPHNSLFKYAYFGFLTTMMLNVLFPHLLITIAERKYSPGLMTGLVLILPIHTIIIMRSLNTHLISAGGLVTGTLAMSLFLLLLIPLMFQLAARLIR